jgi:hypothetical protein
LTITTTIIILITIIITITISIIINNNVIMGRSSAAAPGRTTVSIIIPALISWLAPPIDYSLLPILSPIIICIRQCPASILH